ncbi:uncharacterized protein A4U43_C07F24470 [Asparagus officinalis]|uniref:Uncharacterized protein n=1 Tax=Asparagus officinalis TaxID=4686 RepID=A0A5P1EI16_ASPOF|nr:putative UPF0496 protein 2 [Asparagus officinalis]ONK64321.1 uncharacterized protein A4U43_C07F24470 [Asparagus officinalis]
MWAKLKPSSSSKSSLRKVSSPSSGYKREEEMQQNAIDDEYNKALHTKSYADIYSRLHNQLQTSSNIVIRSPKMEEQDEDQEKNYKKFYQIPDFLLKPMQEQLLASTSPSLNFTSNGFTLHLNKLLHDFFDATFQAIEACASLLSAIDHVRSHHRSIHRCLLSLSSSSSYLSSSSSSFTQLSSDLELENPLSPKTLTHFHQVHSRYPTLIRHLTSCHRKILRILKLVNFTKKASGVIIVALVSATLVAAVIIASHGLAAVVAAPIAVATSTTTRSRGPGKWFKGLKRLEPGVDAAAKGAYIVGRDLDTISQMVRRVHDEVEHGRDTGRMVLRNREWGMVKEVVKEMEGRGGEVGLGLEEQLEELEEHVYLCLVTIDRSRRRVVEEIAEMRE